MEQIAQASDVVGDTVDACPVGLEPLLLRIPEAARLLGVGRTTLYKLIDDGQIRVVHIGRATRVALAEVQNFVARLPVVVAPYPVDAFPRVTALRDFEHASIAVRPPEKLEL